MTKASPGLEADGASETEIELKLTTSPANLAKLLKEMSKAEGIVPDSRQTHRLISTYYDTEDRRLQNKGLRLRIRNKAGTLTQTIKSEGASASGMFTRQEWSNPLNSPVPDLTQVKSAQLGEQMGLILSQELKPLFRTDVKRTTLVIVHSTSSQESAEVELAFDKGRIVAGKKRSDIAEVELELIKGSTIALLDLARVLANKVSSVLTSTSKVARGFELVDGVEPCAVMGSKKLLPKDVTLEDGMALIFRSGLNHLLANRAAAISGNDIEGVHQVRIAMRRIKSALSVFKHTLPSDDVTTIAETCDWLLDTLGPARDLDVFLDEVLSAVQADRPEDTDLIALENAAKKARTAAYRKVRSALTSARYTKTILALALWIEGREWRSSQRTAGLNKPLYITAGKKLSHHLNKVLKLGRKFKKLHVEERHEVRLALKKLRYSAEFFSELYSTKGTRPYIRRLKRLQNGLGVANDVAASEDLTQSLIATAKSGSKTAAALQSGAGKVLGWHARAVSEAEQDIVERWKEFSKSKLFWLAK